MTGASPRDLGLAAAVYAAHMVTAGVLALAVDWNGGVGELLFEPRIGACVLAAYGVLIAGTLLAARGRRSMLGLQRAPFGRSAALVLGGVVAATGISYALEPLFHGVESQDVHAGRYPGGGPAALGLALAVLALAVVGPFAEELFFRGFLTAALGGLHALPMAISTLVFAAVHFEPRAFPVLAILGGILAFVYRATRSILPAAALHMLNNAIAVAAALAAS